MKSPFPSICSCFVVYDPFNVLLATFFVTIVVVLPVNYVLKKNKTKQNKTRGWQLQPVSNSNRHHSKVDKFRILISQPIWLKFPPARAFSYYLTSGKSFQIPLHRSERPSVLVKLLCRYA